jgi:hypothetical protein
MPERVKAEGGATKTIKVKESYKDERTERLYRSWDGTHPRGVGRMRERAVEPTAMPEPPLSRQQKPRCAQVGFITGRVRLAAPPTPRGGICGRSDDRPVGLYRDGSCRGRSALHPDRAAGIISGLRLLGERRLYRVRAGWWTWRPSVWPQTDHSGDHRGAARSVGVRLHVGVPPHGRPFLRRSGPSEECKAALTTGQRGAGTGRSPRSLPDPPGKPQPRRSPSTLRWRKAHLSPILCPVKPARGAS